LMGVASPIVGRLFDRFGPRVLTTVGASMLSLILWLFSGLTADSSVALILTISILFNGSLALLFTPIFATGLNQLPRSLYSHGSAIMSTLQQVAGAVGTAMLVTIMALRTAAYLSTAQQPSAPETLKAAQTAGLQSAFLVATGLAVLALCLTLLLRRSTPPVEDEAGVELEMGVSLH